MVLLGTSEEWQRQSSLLLQARPATTRLTTKYNIPNLEAAKYTKPKKRKRDAETDGAGTVAKVPRAWLVLKTYDPESGVVLKFKTDRAAEVGRLINGLGRLGRHMAALPQETEDAVMKDAPVADEPVAAPAPANAAAQPDAKVQQAAPGSGGGVGGSGGKKKKKGKK